MVEPLPGRVPAPSGVARANAHASPTHHEVETGAAFRALLEKLEHQAHDLKQQSAGIERPEDLAQAVDQAHAALVQAFDLRDQLLEAWRASRQGTRP
jgi:hypothetical protein